MSDLISREAALAAINAYDYRGFTVEQVKIITDGCAEELRKLPAIDAEPMRHGHWVQAGHDGWNSYIKCSKCKRYIRDIHPSDYEFCPHCGAKMGGDG